MRNESLAAGVHEADALELGKAQHDAEFVRLRLDHRATLGDDLAERDGFAGERRLARFEQRQIEDLVD